MNYYWYPIINPCECCGREYGRIHIGKSSYGWCFALHVFKKIDLDEEEELERYVAHDIESLEDWRELLSSGGVIKDEEGDVITCQEMFAIITDRANLCADDQKPKRHSIHRYSLCVGHGDGDWDYMRWEFS